MAARIESSPKVLETATRRMSSGERWLAAAACAMRARTAARFVAMPVSSSSGSSVGTRSSVLRLQLGRVVLRLGGPLAVRRELHVLLDLRSGLRQLAFVQVGHAEPVVRVGVVRL